MNKFKKALLVFWSFFKIGLFTVRRRLRHDKRHFRRACGRRKWITQEDMTDMLIISEMTPGAIAVNSATFVGYRVAGVLGGILGTLGVVLPSLIIITVLSFFRALPRRGRMACSRVQGIQAVVVVLIVNAMVKFFKQLDKNWQSYLIAAAALIVTLLTDFNVIFLILAGGIYGIVYTLARDARKRSFSKKNLDGGENAAAEEDGAERVDQTCGGAEESGGGQTMIYLELFLDIFPYRTVHNRRRLCHDSHDNAGNRGRKGVAHRYAAAQLHRHIRVDSRSLCNQHRHLCRHESGGAFLAA